MKFRIVRRVREEWEVTEGHLEDLIVTARALGHEYAGVNRNPKQRPELQGLPIFGGLYGPMWDGDAIRYEDREARRILSA